MKDFIVARKVKAYRVMQCIHCNQFIEVDLSELFDMEFEGGTKTQEIVCPWCDHSDHVKFINAFTSTDRIVRYD